MGRVEIRRAIARRCAGLKSFWRSARGIFRTQRNANREVANPGACPGSLCARPPGPGHQNRPLQHYPTAVGFSIQAWPRGVAPVPVGHGFRSAAFMTPAGHVKKPGVSSGPLTCHITLIAQAARAAIVALAHQTISSSVSLAEGNNAASMSAILPEPPMPG